MEYALTYLLFWMVSYTIREEDRCTIRWSVAIIVLSVFATRWMITKPEIVTLETFLRWFFSPVVSMIQ